MYVVDNPYYKNHVYDPNRELLVELYQNGDLIENKNILTNIQLTFDSGMNEYTVGRIIYGKLTTTIHNDHFLTNGAELTLVIKIKVLNTFLDRWEWVEVPWGSYVVTELKRKEMVTEITAYSSLYNKLNLGFFPDSTTYTTRSMMAEMARKLDISFDTSLIPKIDLVNPGVTNDNGETTEGSNYVGKTYAELISLIAMVCSSNVVFTRDNSIAFKALEQSDVVLTNFSQPTRGDEVYQIEQVRMVNALKEEFKGGVETPVANHILSLSNIFATQEIANSICNSLNGITYKPWKTSFFSPLHIDPLDIIKVNYKGTEYDIPLLYSKFTFANNSLTCEVESKVENTSEKTNEFKGTITQKIENVYTELISAKEIMADKVNVNQFQAEIAEINNLKANKAEVNDLLAKKADIDDLYATNAEIENLKAEDATIKNLVAEKAAIKDLNATNANITNLTAKVGEIDTLVNGNLTSDNIHSLILTSEKVTVANGFIKNAMIDTLSADKITTGTLNTNNVIISSENGGIQIADATMQFKDSDDNVRLQLGQDATGDFTFSLFGEEGNGVLIDENGIHEGAIADGLIKNEMIGNGEIGGEKIDWSSFTSEFNKETNTNTINASHIVIDGSQQTLNVDFNTLKTQVTENTENTDSLTTSFNVQQEEINSLVSRTTMVENQATNLLDMYSSISQKVTGIDFTVSQHSSQFSDVEDAQKALEDKIEDVETKQAELKLDIDSISTSVNSRLENISIGARNFILKSDVETEIESLATTDDRIYTWNLSPDTPFIGEGNNNQGPEQFFTFQVWYSAPDIDNPFTSVDEPHALIGDPGWTTTQIDTYTYKKSKTFSVKHGQYLSFDGNLIICCKGAAGCKATIKKLQLEQGSIPSAYQRAVEDVVEDFNTEIEDNIADIVNKNAEIQTLVQDILKDDFISEAERSDLALIQKEIKSQYDNIIQEVAGYEEADYFSTFTSELTDAYDAFNVALNKVLTENASAGRVALQELLATYYDAYHRLLYVISQFVRTEYERLETEIIQTNESITNVITSVDDELNERKKFMRFSEDGLELFTTINGNIGNFKVQLTDNRLSFYEGTKEVAFMSDDKLYISNAEVTTSLQIGSVIGRKSAKNGFVFHEVE